MFLIPDFNLHRILNTLEIRSGSLKTTSDLATKLLGRKIEFNKIKNIEELTVILKEIEEKKRVNHGRI